MKSQPRRPLLVVAGAVAVVVAIAALLRLGNSPGSAPAAPAPARAPAAAALPDRRSAVDLAERLASRRSEPPIPSVPEVPPPRSLRETEMDGWIGVDDEGRLVVTPGARWFFDYFLSAAGEEPADRIRARIVAEIEKRLSPPGATEAIDLLDRYLAYRDRVRVLQESAAAADPAERIADLHDIRVETFGAADAAALFGEEEQAQSIDVERRTVLADPSLSPEERERRLGELEERLPPAIRQARSEALAALRLSIDERQLREAGGSPEEIRALREQRFGAEAADRLAALDEERAAWQRRLDDYRQARRAIEGDASLDEASRTRAVADLIAERFSEQERLRVDALDQVRDAGGDRSVP